MTQRDLRRLISLFFTRPLRAADLANAWRGLRRPRRQPDLSSLPATAPVVAPVRRPERPSRIDDGDWRRLQEGVEISEEPLHTLPAELQEELGGRQE
jgi:hypothetical protein